MAEDNLELRCKKAVLTIADNVRDINYKLTHFLENYREEREYYKSLDYKRE